MSRSVAQFIADNLEGVTVEKAQAWCVSNTVRYFNSCHGWGEVPRYKFNRRFKICELSIDELRDEILRLNEQGEQSK